MRWTEQTALVDLARSGIFDMERVWKSGRLGDKPADGGKALRAHLREAGRDEPDWRLLASPRAGGRQGAGVAGGSPAGPRQAGASGVGPVEKAAGRREGRCRLERKRRKWAQRRGEGVGSREMMHEFLTEYREELIARCLVKVAQRSAPTASEEENEHGIPLFLDQLIRTLQVEQTAEPMLSRKVSGVTGGGPPVHSELGESAARHGRDLMERGFTVEQVVHDYGDLCQSVTDLAFELKIPIEIDEFRTLNRCLDNGIAVAVTEFNYRRDFVVAGQADARAERASRHFRARAAQLPERGHAGAERDQDR